MYLYICMHVCMYMCACIQIYVYMYVYVVCRHGNEWLPLGTGTGRMRDRSKKPT